MSDSAGFTPPERQITDDEAFEAFEYLKASGALDRPTLARPDSPDPDPVQGPPCLLEHTIDRGLSPERTICRDLGHALGLAFELTAPGPAEVRPVDLPFQTVAIFCAQEDGSLLTPPDLYVRGTSDQVHAKVAAWKAAVADGTLEEQLLMAWSPSAPDDGEEG